MPRFYFDIKTNDELSIDHDGHDLGGAEIAQEEAIQMLAEMAAELIGKHDAFDLVIAVSDAAFKPVARPSLHFEPDADEHAGTGSGNEALAKAMALLKS